MSYAGALLYLDVFLYPFIYTMGFHLSTLAKLCSPSAEQEPLSVQCVDDPMGLDAVIIYGEQEFPAARLPQVEENHEGNDGDDAFI